MNESWLLPRHLANILAIHISLDVRLGPCMAFLFMSKHLQYLLVL